MSHDVVFKFKSGDSLDSFLADLGRDHGPWSRDRQEERHPKVKWPIGAIILTRPDSPICPRAMVVLVPTGTILRTVHVGPAGPNWMLPSWGFSLVAKRDMAQALLCSLILLDLLAHLARLIHESNAAIEIVESV